MSRPAELVTHMSHELTNRPSSDRVRTHMRARLTLLLALGAPFLLAGCGKGKY
jgi:hypothetical protein